MNNSICTLFDNILIDIHKFKSLHYLPHNFFPKLRQLREEKYDLKFKQRLIALIAGDIVWVLAYWIERVIMGN